MLININDNLKHSSMTTLTIHIDHIHTYCPIPVHKWPATDTQTTSPTSKTGKFGGNCHLQSSNQPPADRQPSINIDMVNI